MMKSFIHNFYFFDSALKHKLKTTYSLFLCVICLNFPLLASSKLILIDPGHGGSDTGARFEQNREAQIVLKISKLLKHELEKQGYRAKLTRTSDKYLGLETREKIAKKIKPDIFISLHANSAPTEKQSGLEIYFRSSKPSDGIYYHHFHGTEKGMALINKVKKIRSQQNEDNNLAFILNDLKYQSSTQKSFRLARSILESWKDKKSKHSIKQSGFYILQTALVPSVLIELGYLSNSKDRKKLLSPTHQKKIAKQIAQGLKNF